MRFPATPGWGPLAAVVCGCLPLLGAVLVAVPRHYWLGSAGRGGGCFSGVGWGVSRGVCVLGAARARVVSVLVCVTCVPGRGLGVGVSSVCVGVCVCVRVCGVWRLVSPAGADRWCGFGCGWCVSWLVPRHSWRRFLSAIPRHSWLGFAAGGAGRSSPLLAEGPGCGFPPLLAGGRLAAVVCGRLPLLAAGPGCGSPPLLAGVHWRRWCVVACHSWVRSWLRFPATPGWGPPAAAVAVSVGLRGGFLVVCVFVARRVRVWCLCWCV